MISRDRVRIRVRTAYERGRLTAGLRTSAMVLPMVAASFGGCGRPATSLALGALIVTLTAVLVWRGGSAGRAVRPAIIAGLVALIVPLVATRIFEPLGITGALPLAACFIGGLGSGAIITRRAMHERDHRAQFALVGGAIAALSGSLGCLGAGLGSVIAMATGVLILTPMALGPAIEESR